MAEVTLHYPGRGAELVIRSWHAQEVTFAHLGAVELPGSAPRLDQHWEGAVASFIAPGALLRDAVDDLDWAGKSARIRVSRDPAGLSFLSSDQTLRLEVPGVLGRGAVHASLALKSFFSADCWFG